MRKPKVTRPYNTVGEFADDHQLSDTELAVLLDCSQAEANRLRHGKKYRWLHRPLHVAKVCNIPIENLVDSSLR